MKTADTGALKAPWKKKLLNDVLSPVMVPANEGIRSEFLKWLKRIIWLHRAYGRNTDNWTGKKIDRLVQAAGQPEMVSDSTRPIDTDRNGAIGELAEFMVLRNISTTSKLGMILEQIMLEAKTKRKVKAKISTGVKRASNQNKPGLRD